MSWRRTGWARRRAAARSRVPGSAAGVRDQFERALRAGMVGTWRWDVRSGEVDWDSALQELFGVRPGTFGRTFAAYEQRIHPDDRPGVLAALQHALRGEGLEYAIAHRILLPDGSVRRIQAAAQVVRDDRGDAVELIGVALTAEDRYRSEAELAHAVQRAHGIQRALDAAQRQLELLAQVGDLLTGTLEVDVALQRLADLQVHALADWCLIDVVRQGLPQRVVVAHRDPRHAQLAAAVRQIGIPCRTTAAPTGRVFLPQVCTSSRSSVTDPGHRHLLTALRDPGSYLSLPLVADGQQLGVMTLLTTDGWRLEESDVLLAAEVSRRCAAVIDRAELVAALARAHRALGAVGARRHA